MYSILCVAYLFLLSFIHFLVSPTFWQSIFANAPVRVIAAAAAVSIIVQTVKKFVPNVNGWVAMALNLAASISALFIGMKPDDFWTVNTLTQVLIIFGTAAGIHSTARSLSNGASATDNATPSGTPAQNNFVGRAPTSIVLLLISMIGCGFMTGCIHQPVGTVNSAPQSIYQQGATIMDDVATDVVSAQGIVVNLHKGGAINDAAYASVQVVFRQVGTYGQQVDSLIAGQASAATISAKINAAIASLTTIGTSTAGVDPNTSAQIQNLVQMLSQLLTKALTVFQPASTTGYLAPQENRLGPTHYRSPGRAAFAAWRPDLPASLTERGGVGYARETHCRCFGGCECKVYSGCDGLTVVGTA